MSALHTINKSPYASHALESCLTHLTGESAVLLMEDAVYAALAQGGFAQKLTEAAKVWRVYALKADLDSRGLGAAALVAGVDVVDYEGFVDLAAKHSAVVPWL